VTATYDHAMSPDDPGLARLNALADDAAASALGACCACTAWVRAMVAGRPYPDRATLVASGLAELARLDWSGVREALDAHPRIGERVAGSGTEAAWSRQEQSGVDAATGQTRAALAEANRAYEQRFGHVFLIYATGRSDTEMLAAARARLANSDEAEQDVVRAELGRIVALRLERVMTP
jgi:2-oxo-4-hydroxy-4-carboxy-5-ureidoimidazoline decarboxylase